MTVRTFYSGTYVADTRTVYKMITDEDVEITITRQRAARIARDPELPQGWIVERRQITRPVPACPWCGARPVIFEMDCDGWASTGTCGSEQCNQLKRCDGCGQDGTVRYGSVRGHLCTTCHDRARRDNLTAADTVYALIPWNAYYGENA